MHRGRARTSSFDKLRTRMMKEALVVSLSNHEGAEREYT